MLKDKTETIEHLLEDNPPLKPEDKELLQAAEYELIKDEKFEGEYPLRDPAEDPRWAVRIIRTWVGLGLFFLGLVITLIILGVFYD